MLHLPPIVELVDSILQVFLTIEKGGFGLSSLSWAEKLVYVLIHEEMRRLQIAISLKSSSVATPVECEAD